MNRLVIIGNGFDLAHGLKTSYKDFIDWYWDQRVAPLLLNNTKVSEDCLCTLKILDNSEYSSWFDINYSYSIFKDSINGKLCSGKDLLKFLNSHTLDFIIIRRLFFERISNSIETKGWVDIENEYYKLLKQLAINSEELESEPDFDFEDDTCLGPCRETYKNLNEQLQFLQDKLVEYLESLDATEPLSSIKACLDAPIKEEDLSALNNENAINSLCNGASFKDKIYYPEQTLFLCFNYTKTAELYIDNPDTQSINYIHGSLSEKDKDKIIFGYGDELDKEYNDLRDCNDNELLNYIKSVKYLEAPHYKDMLRFIESEPFQVFIMGHSCGNSDRTLLNTIFEHRNCVSIKPFYYKHDSKDNYLDIVQNISRNFTDMKLFRDRVVDKTKCRPLGQSIN